MTGDMGTASDECLVMMLAGFSGWFLWLVYLAGFSGWFLWLVSLTITRCACHGCQTVRIATTLNHTLIALRIQLSFYNNPIL